MGLKSGAAISGLSLVGVVAITSEAMKSEKEKAQATCQSLAAGEDMSPLRSPAFGAKNSLDAVVGSCRERFNIVVSEACAAQSIIKTIGEGVDSISRDLIVDAREIEGPCQ